MHIQACSHVRMSHLAISKQLICCYLRESEVPGRKLTASYLRDKAEKGGGEEKKGLTVVLAFNFPCVLYP